LPVVALAEAARPVADLPARSLDDERSLLLRPEVLDEPRALRGLPPSSSLSVEEELPRPLRDELSRELPDEPRELSEPPSF